MRKSEPVANCGRNAGRQGVVRPTCEKCRVTGLRRARLARIELEVRLRSFSPTYIKPFDVLAIGAKLEIGSTPWTISTTGSSTKRLTVDMRLTCTHAYRMSKMVQIRNVPEALHRKLKVRAADAGQTLSDYLLAELERLAARPTREEMLTRLHGRKRVRLKTPAAVVVREERESA